MRPCFSGYGVLNHRTGGAMISVSATDCLSPYERKHAKKQHTRRGRYAGRVHAGLLLDAIEDCDADAFWDGFPDDSDLDLGPGDLADPDPPDPDPLPEEQFDPYSDTYYDDDDLSGLMDWPPSDHQIILLGDS